MCNAIRRIENTSAGYNEKESTIIIWVMDFPTMGNWIIVYAYYSNNITIIIVTAVQLVVAVKSRM